MNPLARGGQPLEHMRKPLAEDYLEIADWAGELLRLVLVAPELEGGMDLTREGAVPRFDRSYRAL